ncbi:hypothetical protein SLS56_003437 [Neofusicoccum ribis]|uniref:Endosomal SPRY domain protein n=1 Tax=Neofusicoccum ribis TaxID=45134 RepID=A0ABR3SZI5_9PEZI
MAPLPHLLAGLLRRGAAPDASLPATSTVEDATRQLVKRATQSVEFGKGAKPASSYNNQGFLALFALIGAGMVLGSIWFFFWAKNGGFKWRQGDWDDYKSTVLRRKGPDGRTLSNATKSTKLGGGSVVHGGGGTYGAPTSVGYTDSSSMVDEKEEQQRRAGDGIRGGGGRRNKRSRKDKDPELADYRHEKAARVGGLNRPHDGTHYDYSNTEPSELGSELSQRPLVRDTKPKDKKAAKKEAEAREKELRKAQKEATKVQKAKVAENKKREKEKAKAMKKSKGKTDRSYSPAAAEPDSPERRRRYHDEMTEVTEATSYTGGYTETEAYSDVYTNNDSSYYSSYRPHAEANIARPTPAARAHDSSSGSPRQSTHRRRSASRSRNSGSPRKQSHSRHHSRSRHGSRNDLDSDVGTKVYSHHIPGLSSGPAAPTIVPEESVSQVGAAGRRGRNVMDGYRRSGVRSRRDSLSDSD